MVRALRLAVLSSVAVVGLMLTSAPAAAEMPALQAGDNSPCTDPWINYAYRTQINRKPIGTGGAGECNIYLYNGGAWQNYDQLRDGVQRFANLTKAAGLIVRGLGPFFAIVNKVTGGKLNAAIRNGSGKVFDINGQPQGGYRLLANAKQMDLGQGSTLIVSP